MKLASLFPLVDPPAIYGLNEKRSERFIFSSMFQNFDFQASLHASPHFATTSSSDSFGWISCMTRLRPLKCQVRLLFALFELGHVTTWITPASIVNQTL